MSRIAIVGASNDRRKYGNKAVRAYLKQGDTVLPVNLRETAIEGLPAYPSLAAIEGTIDIASFYIPPEIGLQVIEDAALKQVGLVILNPGAQSEALLARAAALGLHTIVACSILRIGQEPDDL